MKAITKITQYPRLTALFSGLLAALAFSPFHFIGGLFVSFPLLFFVTSRAATKRQAFATGWWFAFAHLIVCLHWIAASLFVDIASFWWLLPFSVCGLPAVLALFYGVASLLAYRWGMKDIDAIFVFSLCWFLADLARAHLFTGLPWDILGYVWSDYLPILQSVSIWGIEGLTGVTVFLSLLPAFFFYPMRRIAAVRISAVSCLFFAALFVWGSLRVSAADEKMVEGVTLRLVEPNQDQQTKWDADHRLENLRNLLDASFNDKNEKVTHYIWPETATSYYLAETPVVRRFIANHMPQKSFVITGVVRRSLKEDPSPYYNSLVALNDRGDIIAGYDKHHLVPFGEYIPFRSLLPFRVITALGVDFAEGDGIRSVRVPALPPFGALVCYEAIFSGAVVAQDDPPQFLLNLTNDAWYEGTIGIAQHLAMVKVRAVEEGMPLVRVSNKGYTGIVDPWGRFEGIAPRGTSEFVDMQLPQSLSQATLFRGYANAILWLMVVVLVCITTLLRLTYSKI
ncbi:MAG: apolipoprotein N-acyltransferase [Bdellovibrionales bacterium]